MYVIAVYDVAQERTAKMLKLCRRYLHWIQNSVFEGEITEAKLQQLIYEARSLMDPETDSFIIFSSRHGHRLDKQIIGKEKNTTDNFL
ncbi:MAG: CRISPR-associated endoribonuclease Cas2 [Thermonema sp.]|jgi:CRISPR-associated protein Cas2|uniref:CRISPR-associated endonuclease Cas2 n=1 Tax=Thermonema TaxID=28194 RepID=UPI00056EA4AD|nr:MULTISPECIES: CRISPR-associated endonuclease Cas2 [Thermonema]GIV39353.1 MAG: CRISPR-associated endoribonuclease Cas2 [Thermonema sp.]